MKRSELAKHFSDVIRKQLRNEGVQEPKLSNILMELPNELVEVCDNLDMQPPEVNGKYDPVPSVGMTGHYDYHYIREWEKE